MPAKTGSSLISIGNDVIDLQYQAIDEARAPLHDRYLSRVLSASEMMMYRSNQVSLPVFWAAKEAAFKAVKRLNRTAIFSPKHYIYSPLLRSVTWNNQVVKCNVRKLNNIIYASAVVGSCTSIKGRIFHWFDHCYQNESREVRSLARRQIACLLGIESGRIMISPPAGSSPVAGDEAGSDRIPAVYIDNTPTRHQLSLTHHGQLIACMFFPGQEEGA
jgi:phosphopantetheinyl transferase (holo-ACP synthase)